MIFEVIVISKDVDKINLRIKNFKCFFFNKNHKFLTKKDLEVFN